MNAQELLCVEEHKAHQKDEVEFRLRTIFHLELESIFTFHGRVEI